ncbi:MAG: ATP-binding protein [Oscillospiraceae bacterium]|nr:ATP-binding protein [Oscillospiraceae bacterium]
MFIGRQSELRDLNSIYASGKFECVILHGRLRMGKTSLLREFMRDKNCIYFAASETSDRENLDALISCVEAYPFTPEDEPKLKNYYEEVLERIVKISAESRVALIIDEYQYMVSANKDISNLICRFIDTKLINGQLMLILCGSSDAVMESETLGYSGIFHGRRTSQLELEPFSFFDVKRHYSNFSPEDVAIIYGITGGIPKYLNMMNPELSAEENIMETFFNPSSELFEEPENFLRREVRDPSYYNAILKAMAKGLRKNSEIASAVGIETSACTAYLKNLISYGIVSKHTPVSERAGKKTIYEIDDSMFLFWYRFVPDNVSLIHSGQVSKRWRDVATSIPAYMGRVFEDICRQWVEKRNSSVKFPVRFVEVGRWWGTDVISKSDTIIPIVAYSDDDDHALFGDAFWSNEPVNADALRSLEERSRLFRFSNRMLFLFSRSGFTDECAELAVKIGANLVMFE